MNYPDRKREIIERIRELSEPLEPQPTGASEKLSKLNGIKAVLFDVYGTLFISGSGDLSIARQTDTGTAIRDAFQTIGQTIDTDIASSALSELFFTTIEKSRSHLSANGIDYPDIDIRNIWLQIWEKLYSDGIVSVEPQIEAIPLLSNEYECRVNPTWPMPHVTDLLEVIRESGLVTGIVSNAQFFTPLLFEAHLHRGLGDLGFDKRICFFSYEQKVAKPSPVFFEKCMNTLYRLYSIRPEEALYVGNDMLNDIWPSQKLGFRTCLFAGDKRSLRWRDENPFMKDVEPDLIATDLIQLRATLQI